MTRRSIGMLTAALFLLADTAPLWAQRYRPPPPPPIRTYGGGGAGGGGGARTLPSNPRPRATPTGPSRTAGGPSRTSRPANDNARRPGTGASGGTTSVRRVTPLSGPGVTRNSATGNVVRLTPIPARTSPQVQQAMAAARTRLVSLRLLRKRQAAARLARRKEDQLAFETRARELEAQRRERQRQADLAAATSRAGGLAPGGPGGGGGGREGGPPRPANDNVRPVPGARPERLTEEVPGGFRFTKKWREGAFEYEEISGHLRPPSDVKKVTSRYEQSRISGGTGDHAGHRIAAELGGPPDARNLSLQNANVNTWAPKALQERFGGKSGSYRQMEIEWGKKLEVGIKIHVSVRDQYRPGDPRPIARIVRWTETYPDGEKVENEVTYLNPESPQTRGDVR
jgi:hypothetical protein